MRKLLSVVLSLVLLVCSFAGTFTVTAASATEDAIRTAFEEYVESTVLTGTGYSSTYSDAGLLAYLAEQGYADVTIVGAGTTTPQSYLQHAQAGFVTGAAGYENLFVAKDGYVSVVLSYGGENIGCVATIPADTFGSTDIDTVSTDADFGLTNDIITSYTGDAEVVVCNKPINPVMDWGANAANIKVVVLTAKQSFSTSFHNGVVFGGGVLPNLEALVFADGSSFAEGDTNFFSGATKLTHIRLPNNGIHLSHKFANGLSSLVVLENANKVSRVGWAALSGTSLSTLTVGSGHAEWHVRASGLASRLPASYGVTPVWNTLYTCTGSYIATTSDGGSARWNTTYPPIVYFANETALTNFQATSLYANTDMTADYRLYVNDLVRLAATVKASADKASGLLPEANAALTVIKTGITFPEGYTLNWVEDTFAVADGRVTGTLVLSDGTNNIKFDVDTDAKDPEGTIEEIFNTYVESTIITDNGMSSTYSDAGLLNALVQKGHAVTLVDSYLKHSQSGFTTSVDGYENLFEAEDGYVAVMLNDAQGNAKVLTANLPAYTYEHLDIDTISSASDFADTDSDGYFDTYTGSAELVVIPGNVASTITWGDNAANIQAIVYNGSQQFGTVFHSDTTFGSAKLPNLLAFRMNGGSFPASGDINFFNGNNKLTHVALPASGVTYIPHHFLNGRTGVVRVDNTFGTERFGWQAFLSTKVNTIEGGKNRAEFYTNNYSFGTKVGDYGVTPVFILHHTSPTVNGEALGNNRWYDTCPPIVYCNEATYTNIMASSAIGNKDKATYKYNTAAILNTAGAVQNKVAASSKLIALEEFALAQLTAGITLGEGVTLTWVTDTFKVEDGKVTGTLQLMDGTYTVTYAVSADILVPTTSLQDDFEEYVASTVFTDSGYSSTYSDAGLVNYLANKGHIVTVKDSYLKHAKAGFTTGAAGYENLFKAEDGYVSVLLEDADGNVSGYLATIPAYTYAHPEITTVSKSSEFTVTDGVITAYNGTANIVIIDQPLAATAKMDWNGSLSGKANSNINVVIVDNGQTFVTGQNNIFRNGFLANLYAVRFENASFDTGSDIKLFDAQDKLTHISLPVNGTYMIPNQFLNGRSSVIRLDNTAKVERFGWYALSGTNITTLEGGENRDRFYTDSYAFNTKVWEKGVTPVFTFHHKDPIVEGAAKTEARWNASCTPIIYANQTTIDNVAASDVTGLMLNKADWRVTEANIMTEAAAAKAKLDSLGTLSSNASALQMVVNKALSEGYTATWVEDTFKCENDVVTGTMMVSDGVNTVTFSIEAPALSADYTLQEAFKEYVASTIFTDSGYSSTYSNSNLVDAMAIKGFEVEVKDYYLQHAKAGFTTGAAGYETLFAAEDGYVSVLLECGGETVACVAPIPAYTYDHSTITTVSDPSEFVVNEDGVITAYTGSANIVIIDQPIASAEVMDWNGDADGVSNSNINVIIVTSGQNFTADHTNIFAYGRLPNLYATRFESVSFTAGADIKPFAGQTKLTHVSLPESGLFGVPNWFLTSVASVIRVDNTDKVERFGWYAFNGTNLITIEGGIGRSEFYTDSLCFNTLVMNKGVTPVIILHHDDPGITGAATSEARWVANSDGIVPIIYTNKATYDKIHAEDCAVPGLTKNAADWRLIENDFCKVTKVIGEYLDSLVYVGKKGEDLIEQIEIALLADPSTKNSDVTLSWNDTWTVDGDNLSGKLTVSDANGNSAVFPFNKTYNMLLTDEELEALLKTIVPNNNVNTALDFAAQLAETFKAGSDPSGILVRDFYFLRPEGGVKDADGILLPGRKGYAAVVVSATGSSTVYTKTWVIEPEIEDLGKLTVSSEDEFVFDSIASGKMSIRAYTGTAQKLIIPAVGAQISGNWTVANKENVQVIVMNNCTTAFEAGFLHDFPNLKVVIFNDEASAWHTADDEDIPYTATFQNLPSLKYVKFGDVWKEHINQVGASVPTLEALPLPEGNVKQTEGRKFNLTSFSGTNLLDIVIPAGYQTTGALATHQKLFRIGDLASSVSEAWVRAQYAADYYDGAVSKEYLTAELKSAYGNVDAFDASWTEWNTTRTAANALTGNVNATFTLSNGEISFDVTVAKQGVAMGLGETVAERLQSIIDNYVYENGTTEDDLYEALAASLMDEDGYSVSVDDFYSYKSIKGAKDQDGILVPGTDGVVTAVVTLTTPTGEEILYVNEPIKAQYETLTFNSVSNSNQFTYLIEDGERVVLTYNGSAEKVIVPEGVTEIDMMWMSENAKALSTIRALVLPSTLKKLPYALCAYMTNLEAVYIHDNTVNDNMNDEYVFDHCYMLKYVHLPESFTEIPAYFFNHAKSLTAVHIPGNVTYIGEAAFNSTSVSEMVFSPKVTGIGNGAFLGSYAPSCNFSAMDLSASEMNVWKEVSKVIAEETRELLEERGSYYRIFTILGSELVLTGTSLRGGGLPSHRGSHILADTASWSYEDLVAYGYLERTEGGNFDGGTVADLDMTLAQAAAFAQYYATSLVLDNNNVNAVLYDLSEIVSHADGVTVEWKELSVVKATETQKGSANGIAVLKTVDGDTFEIAINEVVSYAEPKTCDGDKHIYDGNCDAVCNICGAVRTATEHTYTNGCDADCDVCGEIRTVEGHQYDNACDATCNYCGATRENAGHQYDNTCDADCNNCGATRETEGHAYDGIHDISCNNCGTNRTVAQYTLNEPSKRVYLKGNTVLDVADGWIDVTYADGEEGRVYLTNDMVTGFDGSVIGKQTLTVTFGNAVSTFDVAVTEDQALPTITVDDAEVHVNQTFTVAVQLANNPGILSAKLAIAYDATKLELISYAEQDFAGLTYDATQSGLLTVQWNGSGATDVTTDGAFVLLTFQVKMDTELGDTVISVSYDSDDVYDCNFENVLFNTANSTVTVITHIPGDVNGDGTVNNKDVGLIQRYINSWDVSINKAASDVNGDGKINNKDLGMLQRYLNDWGITLQ